MFFLKNLVLIIILSIVTYTDFKRQEIDNEPIILGLSFIILFSLSGFNDVSVKSSIMGFLVGGAIFTLLAFWGMGGGDIKLAAMLGFFLGVKYVLVMMYVSFFLGAVIGIFYIVFKGKNIGESIPFGPAMALAALITTFYGTEIINSIGLFWYLKNF